MFNTRFQELLLKQNPETNHIATGKKPKDTGTERCVCVCLRQRESLITVYACMFFIVQKLKIWS